MNIVIIANITILLLLMLETSTRLKLKDSIQFSILTSSIVLFLSTIINNLLISKINQVVGTSVQTNTTVMYILRSFFVMLRVVGDIVGKENIPLFTQVVIMFVLYGLLKGYIRRMLESSNLVVPLTAPIQQYSPFPPAQNISSIQNPYPQLNRAFVLGQEDESPSLLDVEKQKIKDNSQNKQNITGKLVTGVKVGTKGAVEFIGETKKFKDDEDVGGSEVIVPASVNDRVRRIIPKADEDESLSSEIMKAELEKKKQEERQTVKQLAQMINPNVNVSLSIEDKDSAWSLALDYLQGYIMNNLQIPPDIVFDQRRYRILEVTNMKSQGYFKFSVEFFFSSNTLYYFDVYVFRDGEVKIFLSNVMKY